jgi:hypothetical protein
VEFLVAGAAISHAAAAILIENDREFHLGGTAPEKSLLLATVGLGGEDHFLVARHAAALLRNGSP